MKNSVNKLNYFNIGCGLKFNINWSNIDMKSYDPSVIQYNLLNGLPLKTMCLM